MSRLPSRWSGGGTGVVVTHVPALAGESPPQATQPSTEALVFVPEVDDAVSGAVAYAPAIGAADARAIHVAIDPPAAERVKSDWEKWRMPLPLEVVEAPFRSLEQPVLETVRAVTSRPNKIALVVVPGIVAGSWWQDLLHNRARAVSRLATALRAARGPVDGAAAAAVDVPARRPVASPTGSELWAADDD